MNWKSILVIDISEKAFMFIKNIERMTISLHPSEIFSIGNEPLEVLGFQNERDLEDALIPLMQEIDKEELIAS